jgi:pimeloyl-ACP methyl ester carboxylesterase
MPVASVSGIKISFQEYGSGDPVLLIMGSGGSARLWTPHQVPALTAAGYRVVTMENRGVPPSDVGPEGFTLGDMVGDVAGLIEVLGIGPCRVIGFSLGGMLVQELLLAHPGLVTQAVLMASRGRTDEMRTAMSAADADLAAEGIVLPKRYAAVAHAMRYLSPSTLNDNERIRDWLDVFELSPRNAVIARAQRGLELIDNRLKEYQKIEAQCLVMAFRDDLIAPPCLGRELADNIPGCKYEEISDCGHYGYLERPAVVNSFILSFFQGRDIGAHQG